MKNTGTMILVVAVVFLLAFTAGCQQKPQEVTAPAQTPAPAAPAAEAPAQAETTGAPQAPAEGYGAKPASPAPAGGYGKPAPAGGYGAPTKAPEPSPEKK